MSNIINDNWFYNLHVKLNRVDAHKDAFDCENPINKESREIFSLIANDLFGNNDISGSYDKTKSFITNEILKYNKRYTLPITNEFIHNNVNNIPDYIKEYMQDSGKIPNILNRLQLIITPGTYLDPANKKKNGLYYGFDKVLTQDDFYEIGIKYITELSCNLKENLSCDVNIKLSFDYDVNVKFTNKFKANNTNQNTTSKYFKGNTAKNEWFNQYKVSNINSELINDAKKMILCKLIGDALQAYYYKIYLDSFHIYNKKKCILTTCDKLLRLRCILYNIPVLLITHKPIFIMSFDDTNDGLINEMAKVYYNSALSHNMTNISNIQKVLTKKYFYINRNRININDRIYSFLNEIVSVLENINNEINNIEYTIIEKYRQDLFLNKAQHIFNIINGEYILYEDIYRLIPLKNIENDPIRKKNKSLNNIIISLTDSIGGTIYNDKLINKMYDIPLYKSEYDDYTEFIENLVIENEADAIRYAFYHNISNKIEGLNPIDKIIKAESLYSIIFHYYNYIGGSIIQDEFINIIIDKYISNTLKDMTLDEYVNVVKIWYNKVKSEDDEAFEDLYIYYKQVPKNINKTRKRSRNSLLYSINHTRHKFKKTRNIIKSK